MSGTAAASTASSASRQDGNGGGNFGVGDQGAWIGIRQDVGDLAVPVKDIDRGF